MQLSKASYYSDFVIYPILVIALIGVTGTHPTWSAAREWLMACVAGSMLWTLLEYGLHRIALHRMRLFSPLHAAHHGAPLAYIGTPTWISVSVWLGVVLLPVWVLAGSRVAGGLTVGIMLGYWWYGIVHHVIHHRAEMAVSRHFAAGYFGERRAWHMRHHYSPHQGNYGVTTPMWDHVFGTAIGAPGSAAISS
jgi:sterol desaturase/sphingolipid hydroxylase (fatty acid hydroxylase superfamily)